MSVKSLAFAMTLTLAAAVIAVLPGHAGRRLQTTGDAARGERYFAEFGCYECHLYSGHGYSGAPGGASLVPMELTESGFIAYIRNPRTPSRMPPYSRENLSDAEAADIYAHILTFPASPEAEDIPLLREILEAN